MVVADQGNWQADVVVVIEGTANISPYIESLKSNYIIPTLEYFNGSPADDKDCGCDTNCTMYALVVFMAADCAPETSATCFAPTASTHKFLSWLDRVKFIGGAGESHSHVAEGLSTALQVFDDFQIFRENSVATQKHCILICNSPPYPLPTLESFAYSGLMTDQLAAVMAERQINFSVLSPRKIPILFKLYEKAGGDLQHALTKNYAKDRRHLVLLKGFQLQERPMSPPSIDSKSSIPPNASVCSPPATTGQKRPATNSPPHPREASGFKQPASQGSYNGLEWSSENQAGNMAPQNQVQSSIQAPNAGQSPMSYGQNPMPGQPNQPLPQRPGIPTPPSHLNPLNQPNPPNVTITNKGPPQHSDGIRPQRGHSPVPACGPRMSWNQSAAPSSPASTPPTTSVLATQLNMAPSNMPMRHNNPQMTGNQAVNNIVSQAQSMNSPQNVLNAPGNLRGNMPNINLRMTTTSPGPGPIANNNSLAVQLNQHQAFGQNSQSSQQQNVSMPNTMPSIQSKLGNTSGNQLHPNQGQTMTTTALPNMPLQSAPGILPMSQGTSQQGQQPNNPTVTTKDRRNIWQGVLEFQEKLNPQQVQGQRVSHSLTCTFSSMVTNSGESDVNADKWPNGLVLQLIPRQLIVMANLFNTLKTAARHVLIHFNQESEALSKLCKNMSSGLVGCIQFPATCDIRIMVVLYMPDKRIYMGFIANDQEGFFNNIRQIYENHRKQQQQKQRMQVASNIPASDGMGIQSTNTTNPNMMMAQQPAPNTLNANNNQMNSCMPANQQQVPHINPPPPQPQAPNTGMVQSTNTNNQANAARLNQLEAARQQNLLKIQQLQQTLEAAQQKEIQYKLAQEQQKQQQQQQQQQMIDRQNAIRHLQQQLQHQQQQLAQQQQSIQMQQVSQQNSHNPQLRNLLQQQVQVQQMRRQQHQMLMQHPQGIRPQLSGNIPQGGIGTSVGQQQQQQQQSQQQTQQQSWGDLGILDSLPP